MNIPPNGFYFYNDDSHVCLFGELVTRNHCWQGKSYKCKEGHADCCSGRICEVVDNCRSHAVRDGDGSRQRGHQQVCNYLQTTTQISVSSVISFKHCNQFRLTNIVVTISLSTKNVLKEWSCSQPIFFSCYLAALEMVSWHEIDKLLSPDQRI